MAKYLIRRLLHTGLVLIGVSLVVFVLVRLGGDPASVYLPPDATDEEVAALRTAMGWDRPIVVQFVDYIGQLAQGDFGTSLRHRQSAIQLVLERLPATAQLTFVSLAIALVIAVPLGILSALRPNTLLDGVARVLALIGLCMPNFWLGIMLILVFSVQLHWLPAFGSGGVQNLILPALTLGLSAAGTVMRLLRANMLEALGKDYVRTARSKGLKERSVVAGHVLKNAAIPSLTLLGLQIGTLLSGAVVTETVFAYPGMGRLAVQAIENRDFAVVQAFVFVSAVFFAATSLIVDMLYTSLDPRIRQA